ncbi:LOW QUALITY PROTEIN: DNA polymerase epsilon subunit 3-like [Macrobrachium nipponense]|uniref:LOW QUALITY PROTEIN: DNA polymerase epsilon subunit 3-like n=1 Tax=Macrobrachium nipponense TaxID=159736 RepID=UPI0030C80928
MAEKPEDLNLPNAVITRLIKDSLPEGIVVAKEARSAIARAASVFVLYTTSTANNLAQKNKKKTVSAQDIFNAMKEMEFEKFVEPLQESLDLYKKSMQNKKEQNKEAKAKAKKEEEEKKATKPEDKKVTDGETDASKSQESSDAGTTEEVTVMDTEDTVQEVAENGVEAL